VEVWVKGGDLFELGGGRVTVVEGVVEFEEVQEFVEILVLIYYICVSLEEGDIQDESREHCGVLDG
jgi:hypothetical protein